LAETTQVTRLDTLWQAVAGSDAEADWLRLYEGFATARLIVPLAPQQPGEQTRLHTLALETGEVALAFDTEARFNAFITQSNAGPTEFLALTGAALARALGPLGLSLALNPIVSPAETVLDAAALDWVARHVAVEVDASEAAPTQVSPPLDPSPDLLEALGTRLAEMGPNIAEAWLLSSVTKRGRDAFLCVLRPSQHAEPLADEIAAEITRLGQIRAQRPFAVAVVREGKLLAAARRFGIGLASGS
jgi:hypothetical protein